MLLSDRQKGLWLLLGTAAVLLLVQLGTPPLWSGEGRWACIAKEMIRSGNYFYPTINGQLYYDKPLFSYWLVVLFSWPFGVSEWTVRLPNVFSALMAIWATVRIADRIGGNGLLAGWVLLTSFGFILWAHRGMSDLTAAAFMATAIWLYLDGSDRPSRGRWIGMWTIMAIAAQCKGLTGFIVPAIAIGLLVLWTRNWRVILHIGHVWGILAAIVVYMGPFYISFLWAGDSAAEGLRAVYAENFQRYFDPFDHKDSASVYLRSLPIYFLPWTLFWPVCLWSCWRRWNRFSRESKWLLIATACVVAFFSFSGSRREYYILPVLPLGCASLGFLLTQIDARSMRTTAWIVSASVLACGLVLFLIPQIAPEEFTEYLQNHSGVLASVAILVLSAFLAGFISFMRTGHPLAVLTGIWVVVWAACWWIAAPQLDTENGAIKEFAAEVRRRVPTSEVHRLLLYSAREACLVFYLNHDGPIPQTMEQCELKEWFGRGIDRVITFPSDVEQVEYESGFSVALRIPERRLPWVSEEKMFRRFFVYLELVHKGNTNKE